MVCVYVHKEEVSFLVYVAPLAYIRVGFVDVMYGRVECIMVAGWPNLVGGKRQELINRVTVLPGCGGVDAEEFEGAAVEDIHGYRALLKNAGIIVGDLLSLYGVIDGLFQHLLVEIAFYQIILGTVLDRLNGKRDLIDTGKYNNGGVDELSMNFVESLGIVRIGQG